MSSASLRGESGKQRAAGGTCAVAVCADDCNGHTRSCEVAASAAFLRVMTVACAVSAAYLRVHSRIVPLQEISMHTQL